MIDAILEFTFLKVVPVLLLVLLFVVLPWAGCAAYKSSQRQTFELVKDDWYCANVHEYNTTTHIMVGKVLIPQTHKHRDCINWRHK